MSHGDGPRVTLRLLDRAEREIAKLDKGVMGDVLKFMIKFRRRPDLDVKRLSGSPLYSARIRQDYRAILAKVAPDVWLLLTVAHRSEAYDDLEKYEKRLALQVNKVTGGIEFVDVQAVEESVDSKGGPGRRTGPPDRSERLFAAYSREVLTELGVVEALVPLVERLSSEEQLLGLVEYAPQLTGDVLLALHDGMPVERVRDEIVNPQATEETVDTADLASALARPATLVTTDDVALQAVLQGDFERWKVFLHPSQRVLVERDYNGPARVSGGPGTGKTIVALHRAAYLARQQPDDGQQRILLTTYTRNLAADLRSKLVELAGVDVADRVEVLNIDRLARKVIDGAGRGGQRRVVSDTEAVREWRELLAEIVAEDGDLADSPWGPEFLAAEWSQVILGQVLDSFTEYAHARRVGRGRPLSRAERLRVWQLAERFAKRMDERRWTTHAATAAEAARIESDRAERIRAGGANGGQFRYQHVVVDEAQDLHAAHWKLLRAVVAEGRNDLFCVGDTHQRIYDNVVSLGSLGVNIRGRSARLTLNYRTTRQILASTLGLLRDETYDDMDGGTDTLVGYRSVLRGSLPVLRRFDTREQELDGVVRQVAEWTGAGTRFDAVAVCVPTRLLVEAVVNRLTGANIPAVEITADGPTGRDGVHVGTIHRFKGLEFQRMIIAGVSGDSFPPPSRYEPGTVDAARELRRYRSLLFVAATRARDDLAVFWHDKPSRLLSLPQSQTDL